MIDYVSTVAIGNSIPSYASVDEACLYVIEAFEEDFNKLSQEIGLKELGVMEATGKEMVYDEAAITEATNKITDVAKKACGNVKQLFNNTLLNIKKITTGAKSKIAGTRSFDAIKKSVDLAKDKKYGTIHTFPKLAEVAGSKGPIWSAVNTYAKKIASKDATTIGKIPEIGEFKAAVVKAAGGSGTSDSNIRSAVEKYIMGDTVEVNKAYLSNEANLKKLYSYATDYKANIAEVQMAIKNAQEEVNGQIGAMKVVKKSGDGDSISPAMAYMKATRPVLAAIDGAVCSAAIKRCRESANIIGRIYLATTPKRIVKDAKDKHDVNEAMKAEDKKDEVEESAVITNTVTESANFAPMIN